MMALNLRTGLLLGVALILALLLIIAPPRGEKTEGATAHTVDSGEGYPLQLSARYMPVSPANSGRDIFSYAASRTPPPVAVPLVDKASAPASAKKASGGGKESTGGKGAGGIGALKLVGVLLKDEDRLAFVLYRGRPYTLRERERFADHYEVLSISEGAVKIINRQNNNKLVITL